MNQFRWPLWLSEWTQTGNVLRCGNEGRGWPPGCAIFSKTATVWEGGCGNVREPFERGPSIILSSFLLDLFVFFVCVLMCECVFRSEVKEKSACIITLALGAEITDKWSGGWEGGKSIDFRAAMTVGAVQTEKPKFGWRPQQQTVEHH